MLQTRSNVKNLILRQRQVVDPDIVDCANPVASPSVRADEDRGFAPGNFAHWGRIGFRSIEIAFQRRAVMRARDMAPLVALQVLANIDPGPGRRIERKRHVGLRAAPPVSNLPVPGTYSAHRLGHRRRLCALSFRIVGAGFYPEGDGDRTGDVQAGVIAAIDVVPAATGRALAMEFQGCSQDAGDPCGIAHDGPVVAVAGTI